MSSPLYQQLNQQNPQMKQFSDFINQVNNFKKQMQGINPKQEVMNRLQSGMISQQQLNQYQAIANQFNGTF